jgi:hypothetical protein
MTSDQETAVLQEALAKLNDWSKKQMLAEERQSTVKVPLYHYTDGPGLRGIIESGRIWFTDHRHLNDPGEFLFGSRMIQKEISEFRGTADDRVRGFLDVLATMTAPENERPITDGLSFFIASFTTEPDDLGHWRAYAANGKGYALGLSPHLFAIVDSSSGSADLKDFLGVVIYREAAVRARFRSAIRTAASIILSTANSHRDLMKDVTIAIQLSVGMAKSVLASPLIWNCLTSKHWAYRHEREVRLVITEQPKLVLQHIATRMRGDEIVPYIAYKMPIREPKSIFEIVLGPSAHTDAERSIRTMLASLGVDPTLPIRRSDIPYRVL